MFFIFVSDKGSRHLAPSGAVQDTANRICAVLSKIFLILFYFYE